MAQSVLDLILRTKKTGNAETEAQAGLKGMASGLAGTVVQALSLTAALGAAAAVIKSSVNETVSYNKTVREMTLTTGLGAEELSRLIQVGDDWGISVDSMRTAMQMAVKNGFQPSIENLATLADEYVSTTDKTQFAAKAVDIFGRGWTTLIPILAKGGDSLREQAAAVSDLLIATDENIAASREYEVAMDELGDTATGLKMTLGNELIPVLTELTTGLNDGIGKVEGMNAAAAQLDAALDAGIITWQQRVTMGAELIGGTLTLTDVTDLFTASLSEEEKKSYENIIAREKLKTATDELTGATDTGTGAIDLAIKALQGSNLEMEVKKRLTTDLKLLTGELTDKDVALATNVGILTRMYELGQIKEGDYLAALKELNKEGADFKSILAGLRQGIEDLPEWKEITIMYNIKHKGQAPIGSEPGPGAPVYVPPEEEGVVGGKTQMGGSVWPWAPVQWQEPGTGGEVALFGKQGYILNMRQAQEALAGAMGGKGQTVNIYLTANYANMQSESSLAADVRMLMARYGG